jgi:hypothetical protein
LYEYRFVRMHTATSYTPGGGEDYHKVIEEYAGKGWRLVQVLVLPLFDGYSMAQQVELIFEKGRETTPP